MTENKNILRAIPSKENFVEGGQGNLHTHIVTQNAQQPNQQISMTNQQTGQQVNQNKESKE